MVGILSPYDQLLLAAVSADADRHKRVELLLRADDFAWKEAFYVAESNRLATFVATLLSEGPLPDLIAGDARSKWHALRSELEERSRRALRDIDQLSELLSRVDVKPLLYKGPDFQVRCYGDEGPRSFGDLDIIVANHEVDAAAKALVEAGYRQPPGAPSLEYYRRFHLHAIYLHPDHPKGLPVELHWALDSPYSSMPDIVPELMKKAEQGPDFGPNVLRPCTLDSLALMVVHLDKHLGLAASLPTREARLKSVIAGFGLVWVLDVVKWMQRYGSTFDEETTLTRMRELAAERALVIALRLAHDLDAASLPAWTHGLAERLPTGRPWISRVIYPDLSSGQGLTPTGRRRRSFLHGDLPGLGFRPVRLVEALLPSFHVPGIEERHSGTKLGATLRRAALGGVNLWAIAAWKVRGLWNRKPASDQPSST